MHAETLYIKYNQGIHILLVYLNICIQKCKGISKCACPICIMFEIMPRINLPIFELSTYKNVNIYHKKILIL
jgi:hypothetical protein